MDRKPRHSASNGTSKPLSREALRKANHSMIERRRREKINHAFSELRGMVPGLGGGGEGMKGEFKLEVLEKTVEHMRLLMNRLDVLESRQHQSQSQMPSRSQPQPTNHRAAAAAAGAGSAKEEKSRKRKRMPSTPTTVTSSSSSVAESRGRMYHPAPTVRGEKRYRADTEDAEEDEEDEEEDGKEGSSSEEEPLVARPALPVVPTVRSRIKPEYDSQTGTGIPTPQRILHDLDHRPRSRQCYPYEPGHTVVVSQPIGMARILNPTPLTTMSIPAAAATTTTPVLKNRPPLLNSHAVVNSPTPSRTDSEATVLEDNLPEGGSDSGLDFSLGLVDGIAVRVDPTQTGRMEGIVVGDQPTPISSLALAHHHQYQRHPSFSSRFAFPGSGSVSSALGSASGVAMSTGTHERNKKDLFLSNPTELSPLSPFIIGTSSSSTSTGSHSCANSHSTPMSVLGGTSRNGQMVLPEPSPLLPPMMQRQSIAGLFELDPISSGSRSRSGSGSGSGSAAVIAIAEEEQRGGRQGDPRVDEQEAANILLALSSPESMAPTPWHSATRGGDNSPPGAFLLDVPAEDLDVAAVARNEKMEDEAEFDLEPKVISRSTMVTSSARGGRLAKSARDFLNLREDAFGFALTQVG